MKKFIKSYIRFFQRTLLVFFLTLIYFIVIGLTRLFLFLTPDFYKRQRKGAATFWKTNPESIVTPESAELQS